MSARDTGGPAYPQPVAIGPAGDEYPTMAEGMSLRDYFAGQAIIGRLDNRESTYQEDAIAAYKLADAMLAERVK